MSRTLKDRPYRIRAEDERTPRRYESHTHLIRLKEQIGEEKVVVREAVEEWYGKHDVYRLPEVSYMRPVYRYWMAEKPCTIDLPMPKHGRSGWPSRSKMTNEQLMAEKDCFYESHYWPGGRGPGSKEFQRLTNGARRTEVRKQLRNAVREFDRVYDDRELWESFGLSMTLEDVWEAQGVDPDSVDVYTDSHYESRGWWW